MKKLFMLLVVCSLLVAAVPVASASTSEKGDSGDQSADSYRNNDHIRWPEDQALPTFGQPKQLDVIDVSALQGDMKLLLSTLQGIVNRTQPRIYLLEGKPEEGQYTWLNDTHVPYQIQSDAYTLIQKYLSAIHGVIIYDPNVPDSINVATTMAGLKDGIAVSPSLADQLKQAPYNLPVLADLQGQFSNRMDAYQWEYDHLWPETTHRMLIGLSPTTSISLPSNNWDSFQPVLTEDQPIRDSSNRQVYTIDLSQQAASADTVYVRFQDSFPNDGWGPAVHEVTVKADGSVTADFIPSSDAEKPYLYDSGGSQVSSNYNGHRFADGGSYFVYAFPVPAGTKSFTVSVDMWNEFKVSASNQQPMSSDQKVPYGFLRDYAVANKAMVFWLDPNVPEQRSLFEKIMSDVKPGTPYLGWFSSDVSGEFSGTQLTSEHGVYVLAADWFNNMTVLSGAKAAIRPQHKKDAVLPLENKVYVTFTMSEGDNLQYNQHRMREIWDDPNRGQVPINWTTNPLLYDAAPTMLNYYLSTETDNDLLIAGPSGAGYIYPTPWPDDTFGAYIKQTRKYLNRTGLDTVYVLNRENSQDIPLSDSEAKAYAELNLNGLFLNWENQSENSILDGKLPQSVLMYSDASDAGINKIKQAAANWDGKSPLFISVGLTAWGTTPTDVLRIANTLGSGFDVVRGDQFFNLLRQANGLPVKH